MSDSKCDLRGESNLILLSSGFRDRKVCVRDAVDFFEFDLLNLTPVEAVQVWAMDFIQKKFVELRAIAESYGVACDNRTIGSIVREIREKQSDGKSVS